MFRNVSYRMKAIGKSISFRPSKLHDAAISFGKNQKPEINPSEVVCQALKEFFASRGFHWESEGEIEAKFQQRTECLRRLDELGVNVEQELGKLIAEREATAGVAA